MKAKDHLKMLVLVILFAIIIVLLSGCVSYNERFTYLNPATGQTNHTVHVSYRHFLTWGEAAKLQTSTQTEEFIRTVNAEGVTVKGDAEAIKALGAAIGEATATAIKSSTGIP
jgi:regulator of protease activity HflC (stomatin/prohibitin superfamily)